MLVTVVLLVLLVVAAWTDIRWQRISNGTTYPGMLGALAWHASGSLAVAQGWIDPQPLERLGWIPVSSSLIGFFACGLLMLLCYVLLKVGGGDVKLMALLGAFLGPERGLESMLWTFVLGGCLALVVLVWRLGAWSLLKRSLRVGLAALRVGRFAPLSTEERAQLDAPLFLAPSALVAVGIVQCDVIVKSVGAMLRSAV